MKLYQVLSPPPPPSAIDLIPQTATVMPHNKQQPDTEHSIPTTTPSTAAGSYEPGAYMAHPGHASTHHTCCLLQLCVNIFGDFPRCLSTPSSGLPCPGGPTPAQHLSSAPPAAPASLPAERRAAQAAQVPHSHCSRRGLVQSWLLAVPLNLSQGNRSVY